MYFLRTSREFEPGYGSGNRAGFAELVATAGAPVGVLAYRDGEPVGWCATGPRSRYGRLLRSPLLKGTTAWKRTSAPRRCSRAPASPRVTGRLPGAW